MGRKSKPLPSDVEEHPNDKTLVRCQICQESDPTGFGFWIKRTSLTKHLESENHVSHVAQKAEREELERQRIAQFQAISNATTVYPRPTDNVIDRIRSSRPTMFQQTPLYTLPVSESVQSELEEPAFSPDNMQIPSRWNPIIPVGIEPIYPHNSEAKKQQLLDHFTQMLNQAQHDELFRADEDDEDIPDVNFNNEENDYDDEEIQNYFDNASSNQDYFPYPNKITMMLDILDNLPRLRISSNLLRMFLWILKESGVSNTPSYDAFRKMQTKLRNMCGTEPTEQKSMLGNVFYTNDIRQSVAMDLANPEVAKHLHFYPEECQRRVSEVWQAERWKEFKPSELTPMIVNGHRQFYIEEVAQITDNRYVIPHDWVIRNGNLSAQCTIVNQNQGVWTFDPSQPKEVVNATAFSRNYEDVLESCQGELIWDSKVVVPEMPNPLRVIANGDDMYTVMLPLWCDDVSGNRSKQYNKHMNIYMENSNLPGRLLQQEFFVRFVSTSPNATAPEQFAALRDQVNDTHKNPIRCYNAHTRRNCCIILRVPGLPADNPQQSEEASHMGGNANHGCRKCLVGGTHDHTESDEGYHSFYCPGDPRSASSTIVCLKEQLSLACLGVKKTISDLQTRTGIKDKITEYWIDILIAKAIEMKTLNPQQSIQANADVLREWLAEQPGDKYNPLLAIEGLDPTQDTPVEILHTILLGIMKYVWHLVNTSWSDADRAIFAIRLQSTDLDGLTVPPLRAAYMIQYRNNLIGKHFKTLMQTMAFLVHDIVSPQEFLLIKAAGALGALLWVHEIEDMTQYLRDLEVLVGNVLDAFSNIDPSKIIIKIKLHILTHLPEDIRRFGPAIRNSTEIFECFNAIFRLCSVYSNHQAPSRDIAYKFASMDRLKHFLSGGYWKQGDEWVQAGQHVRQVLHNVSIIQRHLGWVPTVERKSGDIRTLSKSRNPPVSWDQTMASKLLTLSPFGDNTNWYFGLSVVAQSGDICRKGSWVFFKDCSEPANNASGIGRLEEIILSQTTALGTTGFVTVDTFVLADTPHPEYDLPILRRPLPPTPRYKLIKCTNILFIFSCQHDCRLAKCEAGVIRQQLQERQLTTREDKLIKHNDDDHFVINTYALHNANLLRKILPRNLTEPKPLYANRKQHHIQQATKLRVSQNAKRTRTQEKRKATLALNQAKKKQRVELDLVQESDEEMVEADNQDAD